MGPRETDATTPRPTASVVLVDDSESIRERVAELVEATPGTRIVGMAGTATAARRLIETYAPDVVVLDLMLPDASGFSVLEWLRPRPRRPAVVVLTTYHDPAIKEKALSLGASVFLNKTRDGARLPAVLSEILRVRASTVDGGPQAP